MFLPDWNSLDSVRRTHSDLEATALIFFALLVFAEVLAHLNKSKSRFFETAGILVFAVAVLAEIAAYPYGQRNDTLSAEVIGSLDMKASHANASADQASSAALKADSLATGARKEADTFEKDITSAKNNAASAESHLADALQRAASAEAQTIRLQAAIEPRQYTLEEEHAILSVCKPFVGKTIAIRSLPYDVEGAIFASYLASLLQKCGFQVDASGVGNNFMQNLPMVMGVHVIGPDTEQLTIDTLARYLATSRVLVAPTEHSPRLMIIVGGKPIVSSDR